MEPAADTRPQTRAPAQPGTHQPGRPAQDLPGTATAPGYASTFPGRADQLSQVRRDITAYLHNCPAADDLILIADELAANAILHTQSRGATFTVRCQLSPAPPGSRSKTSAAPGGPATPATGPTGWTSSPPSPARTQWGTQPAGTGGRTVWARLTW